MGSASKKPVTIEDIKVSGGDKFFAAVDNTLPGGRYGTAVVAGGMGAGGVATAAHFGVGPFEMNPLHIGGGFVAGVVVEEGVRMLTTSKEGYAKRRLELDAEASEKSAKRLENAMK